MRGRQPSRRSRTRTARKTKQPVKRNPQCRLRQEFLEERLVLDGTGFEGNPYAPDLDLSGVGIRSATVGELLTFDLYASGAVVTDLGADGYPSGATIRLQLDPDDNPSGATLTADGILHWTPSSDQVGVHQFVVLAVDEGSPPLADAEVFSIQVFAGNDAPDLAAVADVEATIGEPLEITVTATDSDGDGLTFLLDRDDPDGTVPEGATLEQTDNGTAVIRWTPTASDGTGDFVFSVLVVDDGTPALSDRETFTVTINVLQNHAPTAEADEYDAISGGQLDVGAADGVLANDTDEDGDTLEASVVSGPTHGSLTLETDGSFSYTPTADYVGADSFVYEVSDGTETAQAEVTLQVGTDSSSLVITEINYHPYGPTEAELLVDASFEEDDFEFIELTNVSDAAIDLTGLSFSHGVTFDFADSSITTLLSGESLVLVSNQAAFEARYGTDIAVAGQVSSKLGNEGEQIEIVNAIDEVILDCTYDDEDGWPTEADGAGYTLELIDMNDVKDPQSWSIGDYGGSPGTVPNWDSLVDAVLVGETT